MAPNRDERETFDAGLRRPAATPYPARIAPLIGLQFFALGWVVLNQFRFHLGLEAGARSGMVFKGYLGAELFFVITGFLVAHAFAREVGTDPRRFGRFLWVRLVEIYPLHLAMILLMAGLMATASAEAVRFHGGVGGVHGLVSNLLLIQAWGVEPTVSWNFPSWLVSAEWFALLAFPATTFIVRRLAPNAWVAVAGALALFWILFRISAAHGVLFTDMTAQVGAVQTIPAFLLGAGLYRLSERHDLPRGLAGMLASFAVVWIAAAALVRLTDMVIVPAFAVLTLAVAETAKRPHPVLSGPVSQYLGRISLAIYLVYLPVDIVYFHGLEKLFGAPHGAAAWAEWFGVFPVIVAVGAAAHHLIQRPAAAWLTPRPGADAPVTEPRPAGL
jgi:peptidoglycan/LPS O-acetylase OafA/YrhL